MSSLLDVVHKELKRRAQLIDETMLEAMEDYGCDPEDLTLQMGFEGSTEVVKILGPRPVFRELRFQLSKT